MGVGAKKESTKIDTHTLDPSQYLLMQAMQKLWPHGVDEGLLNTSKQIEHWNCSSDRKLPYKDILWREKRVIYSQSILRFFSNNNLYT